MTGYHAGELAVQSLVGVRHEAARLSGMVDNSTIKPAAQEFLRTQQLAILSSTDANQRIWTSWLTGAPGFVTAIADQTVQVDAVLESDDPLHSALQASAEVGLLVIDLANRRRLRINGKAALQPNCSFLIQVQQAYFNCPKYIQVRHLVSASVTPKATVTPKVTVTRTAFLDAEQQQWIAQADTCFIASAHPSGGADASHRGGFAGFVQVIDSNCLVLPDYPGNNMFNTLGNLFVNSKAGLLFINFEQGHTLQLTGTATIIWDAERIAAFNGAERLMEFQIQEVRQSLGAIPLHWQWVEYSPANLQIQL